MHDRIPVIILGYGVTALGTARCLQATKFHISVLGNRDIPHKAPLYYSRIPERKFLIADAKSLVDSLKVVRREFDTDPVLLLTTDYQVLEIAARLDEISSLYRLSIPPKQSVERAIDKTAFQETAEDLGILVPRSIVIGDSSQWNQVSKDLEYPFVVKPHLRHARRVNNPHELEEFLGELRPIHRGSMIAQEWIPGGDDHLYCCFAVLDDKLSPMASFALQKLRQWRPRSGTTSLCRSVANRKVIESGIRILQLLGAPGFGSVEFKRHPEDGRLYVLEPTVGRFNQQIALARAAGVNLPDILAAHLAQLPIPSINERIGAYWIHELNDFLSSRDARQPNRGGFLKYLAKADVRVFWSKSDPGPALVALPFLIGMAVTGSIRRQR